jgi:hypothetical protein
MPRHILFAAPHRVMFTGGIVQLLLVFALWAGELLLRAGGQGATGLGRSLGCEGAGGQGEGK